MMSTTAKRLLADIQELAPDITKRAAEIEAGRRIPLDLVDALRSTGVFRMFVPRSHRGLEFRSAERADDLERRREIVPSARSRWIKRCCPIPGDRMRQIVTCVNKGQSDADHT
jgi:alkylation response protein AidB-like acyl-CoA dehydrogenase